MAFPPEAVAPSPMWAARGIGNKYLTAVPVSPPMDKIRQEYEGRPSIYWSKNDSPAIREPTSSETMISHSMPHIQGMNSHHSSSGNDVSNSTCALLAGMVDEKGEPIGCNCTSCWEHNPYGTNEMATPKAQYANFSNVSQYQDSTPFFHFNMAHTEDHMITDEPDWSSPRSSLTPLSEDSLLNTPDESVSGEHRGRQSGRLDTELPLFQGEFVSVVGKGAKIPHTLHMTEPVDLIEGWSPPATSLDDAYRRLKLNSNELQYPDVLQMQALSVVCGLAMQRVKKHYEEMHMTIHNHAHIRQSQETQSLLGIQPSSNDDFDAKFADSTFDSAYYSNSHSGVSNPLSCPTEHEHNPSETSSKDQFKKPLKRQRKPATRNVASPAEEALKIFVCTWPECSANFKSKSERDWRRHEGPTHCPQFKWTCPVLVPPRGYGRESVCGCEFTRDDKLREHLENRHPEYIVRATAKDVKLFLKTTIEDTRQRISPSKWFRQECGFCGVPLTEWEDRMDHIAHHFKVDKKTMSDWKDPWPRENDFGSKHDNDDDDEDDDEDNNDGGDSHGRGNSTDSRNGSSKTEPRNQRGGSGSQRKNPSSGHHTGYKGRQNKSSAAESTSDFESLCYRTRKGNSLDAVPATRHSRSRTPQRKASILSQQSSITQSPKVPRTDPALEQLPPSHHSKTTLEDIVEAHKHRVALKLVDIDRGLSALESPTGHQNPTTILPKVGDGSASRQELVNAFAFKFERNTEDQLGSGMSYRRPKQERLLCDKCTDYPSGFRGRHELGRHIDRQHKTFVKEWICVEPSDASVQGGYYPVNSLSDCNSCLNRKAYGAFYSAAAHLRRAHFNKSPQGGSQSSAGKGGRDWPPMKELKRWMKQISTLTLDRGPQLPKVNEGGSEEGKVKAAATTKPPGGAHGNDVHFKELSLGNIAARRNCDLDLVSPDIDKEVGSPSSPSEDESLLPLALKNIHNYHIGIETRSQFSVSGIDQKGHLDYDVWYCADCFKSVSSSRPPVFNSENCSCAVSGAIHNDPFPAVIDLNEGDAYRNSSHDVYQHHQPMTVSSDGGSIFAPEGPERMDPDTRFLTLAPAFGLNEHQHRLRASFDDMGGQLDYALRRYLETLTPLERSFHDTPSQLRHLDCSTWLRQDPYLLSPSEGRRKSTKADEAAIEGERKLEIYLDSGPLVSYGTSDTFSADRRYGFKKILVDP